MRRLNRQQNFPAAVLLGVLGFPGLAPATVNPHALFGDAYIVREGSRRYSVLDVYLKGSSTADTVSSIFGVSTHPSAFTMVQGDAFVQTNGGTNDAWLPSADQAAWDSFVTCGNRDQASAASSLNMKLDANWGTGDGAAINNAAGTGGPGWYPAVGASTSVNPYARIGFYNGNTTTINSAKASTNIAGNGITVGQSLNNHWMIGRFVIDVSGDEVGSIKSMSLRFAFAGKQNGTTTGTWLTSPSPGTQGYILSFAPRPCDGDIDLDGQCDGWDLGLLLLDFGPCPDCDTDLDGSGTVDTGDMSLLLMDWNAPC